ncbi:hypothetical protein [Streptomyces glaucescens]|uniref:Integral membrane protein n=1 Tax=Streptomyces glaucescens TaxID=1907 RepID=A0A089XD15_STRGA|nr:hypothetical protein [Streptomyces glaucescens]AIR99044.1 integral membrane protein [Streptomyces glaucescens]
MGIESDKVVYEYLSRVGDVAQQRQLPSAARMRLVSQLRDEIDRRRAKAPVDSPAAVRRIIDRLGSPDDVVTAAGDSGAPAAPEPPRAAVPAQRDEKPGKAAARERRPKDPQEGPAEQTRGLPKGLRRIVPRPRPAEPGRPADDAPSPPHLASLDELGHSAGRPDWWRVDGTPFGAGEAVPGFVGGVEIPELLKPPPADGPASGKRPAPAGTGAGETAEETAEATAEETPRRRLLPVTRQWNNPLLLLAAALLVAGAALGHLLVLALGWLIVYLSRRLTQAEVKWAVMVLPALAVAGGFTWLWGRTEGRWGEPIPEGGMGAAVGETWPWVLRGAALASAAFLVWRSQRQR